MIKSLDSEAGKSNGLSDTTPSALQMICCTLCGPASQSFFSGFVSISLWSDSFCRIASVQAIRWQSVTAAFAKEDDSSQRGAWPRQGEYILLAEAYGD